MATVTGLTAERMLAIEAASVVDGDIVGDNLILTQHGGTQINAGNVRGPAGPTGPVGQDLIALAAKPVLHVGLPGQLRAGRQLTAADFTNMGLAVPLGLWNLSDLTDASGNGRNLVNKGGVAFDTGINGLATTSAKLVGNVNQALYILDTGAADPFRIKTGSWGCWFRTQNLLTVKSLISKRAANLLGYDLYIDHTNKVTAWVSQTGTAVTGVPSSGANICDDVWHHAVATFDGSLLRLYVDGAFEGQSGAPGPIFQTSGPLNIGSIEATAGANTPNPYTGRIDEAFVTADVLSEDQIRNLYCAKIPHTLAAVPSRVSINVRRRRKGSALVVADFSTQPLRLHNFSAGSMGDEGSLGVPLNLGGAPGLVGGVDGSPNNAYSFDAGSNLHSSDAGLPSALISRSYGCWFKTSVRVTNGVLVNWGNGAAVLWIFNQMLHAQSGGDTMGGSIPVCDGLWHHAVVVENDAALDGKRKLYLDGRLIGGSNVMNPIALIGNFGLRVGCNASGGQAITGLIDSMFITNYAMPIEEIQKLFNKASQTLAPSPKNVGEHVEAMTTTDILATFNTLESQHLIDLTVAP